MNYDYASDRSDLVFFTRQYQLLMAHGRKVTTASIWQARQPIYRSSVERWLCYEPWLGELRELAQETEGRTPHLHDHGSGTSPGVSVWLQAGVIPCEPAG